MRYYLDEDQSRTTAVLARQRLALDVTCSHELGMDHATDSEQLQFAASSGRCLVTRNGRDFYELTLQCVQTALPHCGVLVIPRSMYGADYWTIARALAHYHRLHPQDFIPYLFDYLPHPPVTPGRDT